MLSFRCWQEIDGGVVKYLFDGVSAGHKQADIVLSIVDMIK